jgi:hypothetical protein
VLPVFLSSYVLVPFNLDPVVRNELKGKMTTPHMVFFVKYYPVIGLAMILLNAYISLRLKKMCLPHQKALNHFICENILSVSQLDDC